LRAVIPETGATTRFEGYNLERKRTVFNVFGWLAEAARS
jgi:hypothetical protein